LNDPGFELVRAALAAGHSVTPLPGPCAPIAALVASGLSTDAFLYLGYLPRKKNERQQFIEKIKAMPYTLVLLETPHRLLAALADLESILGDRPIAVARELTKLHEEILRLPLKQARQHFEMNPPRGEFTLVVSGCPQMAVGTWTESDLTSAIQAALQKGEPISSLAARLAAESGWERRKIYKQAALIRSRTKS